MLCALAVCPAREFQTIRINYTPNFCTNRQGLLCPQHCSGLLQQLLLSLSSIFPLLVLRTRRADKSQAADVLWVLRGVNSSDVPTHGGADQVEGPLVQLDALHELHGGRRSVVRAGEARVWGH